MAKKTVVDQKYFFEEWDISEFSFCGPKWTFEGFYKTSIDFQKKTGLFRSHPGSIFIYFLFMFNENNTFSINIVFSFHRRSITPISLGGLFVEVRDSPNGIFASYGRDTPRAQPNT